MRSGTTYLSQLINWDNQRRDMFEPDRHDILPVPNASLYISKHMRPDDENELLRARASAQRWVDYYDDTYQHWETVQERFNAAVRVYLQARWVVTSPAMGLASMIVEGPYKSHSHMRSNRYRPTHFRGRLTEEGVQRHRAYRARQNAAHAHDEPLDVALFEDSMRTYLSPVYQQLRERNASLLLVRLPTSGILWEWGERVWPKAVYWDHIEEITGVPTVHSEDYKELRGFVCPDLSHLDAEDAFIFTERLAPIIRKKLGGTMVYTDRASWHVSEAAGVSNTGNRIDQ